MRSRWLCLLCIVVAVFTVSGMAVESNSPQSSPASAGAVHTYYVAADEVEWNYAPGGINKMMGHPFEGYAKEFIANTRMTVLRRLSRVRQNGSMPEYWAPSCAAKWATRFA